MTQNSTSNVGGLGVSDLMHSRGLGQCLAHSSVCYWEHLFSHSSAYSLFNFQLA